MQPIPDLAQLRYVRAADVSGGDITLEDFEVRDARGLHLGRLSGLLIDSATERVCYIVVGAWRGIASDFGLLPLEAARLDARARVVVMLELKREGSPGTPCGTCTCCIPCTYCTQ